VIERRAVLASASLLLAGCAFSRSTTNESWMDLDTAGLEVGRSTFVDVLDRLGPPALAAEERHGREPPVLRAFRYPVAAERVVHFTPSYWVSLPCAWTDDQRPFELLVEFDGRGVVSRITERTEGSIWRPIQPESSRERPTTRFPGAPGGPR
jgi:hypothetical protein